jgi:ABC-2 type transport system ATP-binding protein
MAAGGVRLSIQGLSKRYGVLEAVRGVSFRVAAGEIVGLLGANGAGKTTTLECILGLRRPDDGEINVCGIDALRHPRRARARIGAALQQTGLQDKITPREALAQFVRLHGAGRGSDLNGDALLARFGLTAKADACYETLSGGQKQRLALALAFAGDPPVLLLDEAAAGLDVGTRRALHDDMRAMRAEGRALLITTHDMSEAMDLCDRIAVLHHGRVVAKGTPQAVIGAHASLEDAVLALTSLRVAGGQP